MIYSMQANRTLAIAISLILLVSSVGLAAERPDAGKTLGGVQMQSDIRQSDKASTGVTVEQPPRPKLSKIAGPKILVKGFRITGQNIIPETKLLSLLADAADSELSLAELEGLAERITLHFQQQGYLVARAYIPAQEIRDNVVEISVMTGKYGKITVDYAGKAPTDRITDKLESLQSGAVIEKVTLERSLLLINDIPGIAARASLASGDTAGTSNLSLKISQTKPVTGSVGFDNYGNLYTGRGRLTTAFQFHSPAGWGDRLEIVGLGSDSDLKIGQVLYALPSDDNGGTLTLGYTRMVYELGEEFKSLDAYGEAKVKSIHWSYPFKRTPNSNLFLDMSYEGKQLQDTIDAFSDTTDKKSKGLTLALSGDHRAPDGIDSYSASFTAGNLDILSLGALLNDQANLKTNGDYKKWNFSYLRQQFVSDKVTAFIKLTGQTANKNLDSSEKLSLGGPYGVRAHPQGEASGDQGYLFSGELRWLLSQPGAEKHLQLATYFDAGTVMINKHTYSGAGDNRRTLAGMGVGLIYGQAQDFAFRFDYAWKTNNENETSESPRNGRFWLQGTKYF